MDRITEQQFQVVLHRRYQYTEYEAWKPVTEPGFAEEVSNEFGVPVPTDGTHAVLGLRDRKDGRSRWNDEADPHYLLVPSLAYRYSPCAPAASNPVRDIVSNACTDVAQLMDEIKHLHNVITQVSRLKVEAALLTGSLWRQQESAPNTGLDSDAIITCGEVQQLIQQALGVRDWTETCLRQLLDLIDRYVGWMEAQACMPREDDSGQSRA